ncbi:predicted protein, partial [Nematostella vectensis]
LRVEKRITTTYHHQCNCLCERQMRTVKTMLASHCEKDHRTWDIFLQADIFAYNTSLQASLRMTP